MPSLKMKAKSSVTCIKEVRCLRVSQKSRKISKDSFPLVRICCETAEGDTSIQNCNNGSTKVELAATTNGSNEASDHNMWREEEYSAFPKYLSSAEDPIFVKEMVRSLLCHLQQNLDIC